MTPGIRKLLRLTEPRSGAVPGCAPHKSAGWIRANLYQRSFNEGGRSALDGLTGRRFCKTHIKTVSKNVSGNTAKQSKFLASNSEFVLILQGF